VHVYAVHPGQRTISVYRKYLCDQIENFIGSFHGFFMRNQLRSTATPMKQHGQKMPGSGLVK